MISWIQDLLSNFLQFTKHQLMTASMVHLAKLIPGSGVTTLVGRMVEKHQWMTAGMVHVTNRVTPETDDPTGRPPHPCRRRLHRHSCTGRGEKTLPARVRRAAPRTHKKGRRRGGEASGGDEGHRRRRKRLRGRVGTTFFT